MASLSAWRTRDSCNFTRKSGRDLSDREASYIAAHYLREQLEQEDERPLLRRLRSRCDAHHWAAWHSVIVIRGLWKAFRNALIFSFLSCAFRVNSEVEMFLPQSRVPRRETLLKFQNVRRTMLRVGKRFVEALELCSGVRSSRESLRNPGIRHIPRRNPWRSVACGNGGR